MDLLEVLGLSPPAAENALCYEIYDERFIHGASETDVEKLCDRCMQLVSPYLRGYIWQHEPFRLQSSTRQLPPWLLKKRGKRTPASQQQQQQQQPGSGSADPPFLWGVLRYGDAVDDEWWVVWLLLELSRQLLGLCIRAWDDDGEFLLIEAAYALPRWLKPETSSNRVWLRAGGLHIIPPPSRAAPQLPASPSTTQALHILGSGQVNTHNPRVAAPVLSRLAGYPSKACSQLQRVTAWLPRRVGRLLQEDPQLVAAAVDAFVSRQREDVQAAAKMSNFLPADMTTALLTLNRCMYAQLLQAEFAPPRGYPASPAAAAAAPLPPAAPAAGWLAGDAARQEKAYSLGLKVTTGMEIMAARLGLTGSSSSSSRSDGAEGAAAAAADSEQQQQQQLRVPPLSGNPAWRQYVASLNASGYFSGELEGSARHRQLLAAAQAAFTASPAYQLSCEAAAAPARHLLQLLDRIDAQQQQQQQQGAGGDLPGSTGSTCTEGGTGSTKQLSPAAAVLDAEGLQEDPDGWMEEEAEKAQQQIAAAEAEVAAHEARKQQRQARTIAAAAAARTGGAAAGEGVEVDAEQLVAGFKGFVQAMASHEGAEAPGDGSGAAAAAAAARDGSSSSKPAGSSSSSSRAAAAAATEPRQRAPAGGVEFNADSFLQELMGVMGAAALPSSRRPAEQQQQQQDAPVADALLSQLQSLQQQLEQCLQEDTSGAAAAGAAAAFKQCSGGQHGSGRLYKVDDSGDDAGDDDEFGTSSSEGSSFYGSDQGSEDEGLYGEGLVQEGSGAVQLPVPPPVSGRQQQQQGQQQQQHWQLPPSFQASKRLQEAWEVMTATDSDDDEDALSLGGEEDDEGTSSEGGTGLSDEVHSGEGVSEGEEDGRERPLAAEQAQAAAGEHSSGRGAAAGSGAAGFFDAYSSAMDAELAGTTLVQSFERVGTQDEQQPQQQGQAGSAAAAAAAAAAGDASTAGLAPLDVDMNLIRSLVKSYTAQGGLPGPASNLAGLLGLQLPTEVLEEK